MGKVYDKRTEEADKAMQAARDIKKNKDIMREEAAKAKANRKKSAAKD